MGKISPAGVDFPSTPTTLLFPTAVAKSLPRATCTSARFNACVILPSDAGMTTAFNHWLRAKSSSPASCVVLGLGDPDATCLCKPLNITSVCRYGFLHFRPLIWPSWSIFCSAGGLKSENFSTERKIDGTSVKSRLSSTWRYCGIIGSMLSLL
jgi:hypothetical protein